MELKQHLQAWWRWSWAIVLCAVLGGVAGYTISRQLTPTYQASTTLLLPAAVPSGGSSVPSLFSGASGTTTAAGLLRGRAVVNAVVANLNLDIDPEALIQRINVSSVRDTPVLIVNVEDRIPTRAANIANEIVRVFIAQTRELEISAKRTAIANLEQSLAKVMEDTIKTQASLDALNLVPAPEQSTERNRLQGQLEVYRSTSQALLTSLSQARIDELQRPDPVRRNAIANMEQQLAVAMNQIVLTQASLDAIKVTAQPDQLGEQTRLQGLLQLYRNSAQSLQQSLDRARIDELQRADSLITFDAAEPPSTPVSPRPPLNAVLATIIAALAAIGVISLRTALDDSVRTAEDIERLTGLPTVATIARSKGVAHRLNVEAYRLLAAKVELAATPSAIRSLVVTGALAGENTSTTTVNLAAALSEIGKYVVVVDAVLENPQAHKFFGHFNQVGVTTALSQLGTGSLYEHMQFTGFENLMLLSAGPTSGQPDGLLRSQHIESLLKELEQSCDYVLFCAPALPDGVDALRLAHLCDATLLIARVSSAKAAMLNKAKLQLEETGAQILGVVLEGVKAPRGGKRRPVVDAQPAAPRAAFWSGFRLPSRSHAQDRLRRPLSDTKRWAAPRSVRKISPLWRMWPNELLDWLPATLAPGRRGR